MARKIAGLFEFNSADYHPSDTPNQVTSGEFSALMPLVFIKRAH